MRIRRALVSVDDESALYMALEPSNESQYLSLSDPTSSYDPMSRPHPIPTLRALPTRTPNERLRNSHPIGHKRAPSKCLPIMLKRDQRVHATINHCIKRKQIKEQLLC
jgi:hypothetical protein